MSDIGRGILILGVLLVVVGGAILLLGRSGVPIGKLPGDITYRGKNTTVYFPIVTCIVISVVLSLLAWIIQYFRK
jgi:hypothetical protein